MQILKMQIFATRGVSRKPPPVSRCYNHMPRRQPLASSAMAEVKGKEIGGTERLDLRLSHFELDVS